MWQVPAVQSAHWPPGHWTPSSWSSEFVDQRGQDSAPVHAIGMPQRDRAAIGIQPLAIEMQVAVARQHLRGKRFVQFHRVVIFHLRSCALD